MFVWLEGIRIYFDSLEEDKSHVRQVLEGLLENRLYVKS